VLSDIGFFEIAAIAVLALLIFGPERLPKLVSDGARMLREVRRMASGARQDLKDSLGPELSDLNISDLDPRTFVKRNLLDPIDEEVQDVKRDVNGDGSARPASPGFDADTT
jgi:sec-independent protein translocase protein TatB